MHMALSTIISKHTVRRQYRWLAFESSCFVLDYIVTCPAYVQWLNLTHTQRWSRGIAVQSGMVQDSMQNSCTAWTNIPVSCAQQFAQEGQKEVQSGTPSFHLQGVMVSQQCLHSTSSMEVLVVQMHVFLWGGVRRSPVVACWASDHWVASLTHLGGKFR